jgi:hypothetical protein
LSSTDLFTQRGLDFRAKAGARTGVAIHQRLGAVFIVIVQPIHDGLRVATCAFSHPGGTPTLGNLIQGKPSLTAADMRGTQGQLAQVSHCLAPALMVNVQHQSRQSLSGEIPHVGTTAEKLKGPNYGSQTRRGLD